jgi:hypothetical protein
MGFDFASLTLLLFWILSRSFFENFAKKDKVPRMAPSIAQVVFVASPKALSEPQLPTSIACVWSFGYDKRDSLVLHDVVEPKTGSKKKLVMQIDRDVQVCGIFLCFLNTPCFEILLLPLLLKGLGFTLFSMLFDWSTFFLCFLSIYFFQ